MRYDGIIELEGMEFHAFHGCLEKERREGNTFLVDFHAETELKKAVKTDDLRETADYGEDLRHSGGADGGAVQPA